MFAEILGKYTIAPLESDKRLRHFEKNPSGTIVSFSGLPASFSISIFLTYSQTHWDNQILEGLASVFNLSLQQESVQKKKNSSIRHASPCVKRVLNVTPEKYFVAWSVPSWYR